MNMIEKVAQAIEGTGIALDQMHPDYERHLRIVARASIEAMREPMPDENYRFERISQAYKGVWIAMIDAALRDGQSMKQEK